MATTEKPRMDGAMVARAMRTMQAYFKNLPEPGPLDESESVAAWAAAAEAACEEHVEALCSFAASVNGMAQIIEADVAAAFAECGAAGARASAGFGALRRLTASAARPERANVILAAMKMVRGGLPGCDDPPAPGDDLPGRTPATTADAINASLTVLRGLLAGHAATTGRRYELALRVSDEHGAAVRDEAGHRSVNGSDAPESEPDALPEPAEPFDPTADTAGPCPDDLPRRAPDLYLVQWTSGVVSLVSASDELDLERSLDEMTAGEATHRSARWRRYRGPVWVDFLLPCRLTEEGVDLPHDPPCDLSHVRAAGVEALLDEPFPLVAALPASNHDGFVRFFDAVMSFGYPAVWAAFRDAQEADRDPTRDEMLSAFARDVRPCLRWSGPQREAIERERQRHNEDDPANYDDGVARALARRLDS